MNQYFFNTRKQLDLQLSKFDNVEIGEKLALLMTGKKLESVLKVEKRLILRVEGGVAHIGRIPFKELNPIYLY